MVETDIVNMALSRLGDVADVTSIAPPDGSTQAEYAARFYPNARDSALEMREWTFATAFAQLAAVTNTSPRWSYAFAKPNDALKILGTVPAYATGSDYYETVREEIAGFGRPAWLELLNRDNFSVIGQTIFTNCSDVVFMYTRRVTDPTLFPALFSRMVSWLLAADIAGPLLKGQTGTAAAKLCTEKAMEVLTLASTQDANQERVRRPYYPAWIAAR